MSPQNLEQGMLHGTAKKKRTTRSIQPRKSSQLISDLLKSDDEESDESSIVYSYPGDTPRNTLNEEARENLQNHLDPEDRDRGTHVKKYILRITKNTADALTLSQIQYWIINSGKHPRCDKHLYYKWSALSSKELSEQLHRTEDEIEKSLKRLQSAGFIDWKTKFFNGSRKRHIWINWEKIASEYQKKGINVNG